MTDSGAESRRRVERILAAGMGLGLLAGLPVFLFRVLNNTAGTDFPEFYAAGRHILEHGTRHPQTILHLYLPSVDVAWVVVAWLPLQVAAPVYYLFMSLCWVGLLHSVGRYLLPATPRADHRIVLLSAGMLTLVFAIDHLLLGAFHILMVWLMVEGLGRVASRRPSGPVLLGMAVWIKMLPVIAVGYLLLKRRWRPAFASMAVAVGLDVALSLAAYGPAEAWALHQQWWASRAVGGVHTVFARTNEAAMGSDRNQSPAAVFGRLLYRADMASEDPASPPASLTKLAPLALKGVYLVFMGGLAVSLMWFWRKPAVALDPPRWAGEVALVVLATLWFSPIAFSYHPVSALPALAVVLGSHWERSPLKRWTLLAWILAVILLAVPQARDAGEFMWASLLLGFTVMVTASKAPDS